MNSIEERYIDSREVAEMVGKDHHKLLRDIRTYISQLGEAKIGFTDFFKESSYTTEQNKSLPCYLVTKNGCEFIAHKMTGTKGTEFTAKYIDRFHDMEDTIKQGFDLSRLSPELQAIFAHDKKLQLVMNHMEDHESRIDNLENTMTVDYGQQKKLNDQHHATEIKGLGGKDTQEYGDKELRDKVFRSIWRDYKDYFGISSYKDTPAARFGEAMQYLSGWRPDMNLRMEIDQFLPYA